MLAFYLQRLQVSCALSQGKRNILKNPDPGLRQTLVKIYNKVKELKKANFAIPDLCFRKA